MSVLCSGSFVADILVPELPCIGPPGSLTYAPKGITISSGGHSGNVAIDLSQLGVPSIHAAGSIGKDMMGEFLVNQLHTNSVHVHAEVHENTTTAKNIALLVKNEDRRFIAELTANSLLTSLFLKETLDLVKPTIYYQGTLGGLPIIEEKLAETLSHAKELGSLTFVDVIMPSNGWDYLKPALQKTDVIHLNLDEGKSLTGLESPIEIVETLTGYGAKAVILTDGDNGLTAGTKKYHIEMPAYDVTQLDPTGAGDALCAGIIHQITLLKNPIDLYNTQNFIETLIIGQATGAACVTGLGATTNVQPEIISKIVKNRLNILKKTKTVMK